MDLSPNIEIYHTLLSVIPLTPKVVVIDFPLTLKSHIRILRNIGLVLTSFIDLAFVMHQNQTFSFFIFFYIYIL